MERLTALADFFAANGRAEFLRFWENAPLRDPAFWQVFWDSLWTRDAPMAFLSYTFWVFLALCALAYYLCPRVIKPVWLLLCSYAFYLYDRHGTALVAILIGATALTWLCGLAVGHLKSRPARLVCVWLAVLCCIGTLGYYKYSNFFGGLLGLAPTALPAVLGLSYFIFQALGYVLDVYHGTAPVEHNPLYYALYVSFFPCIVSGPIERADHLIPQLRAPRGFQYKRVAGGAFRMLWGAFKKLVIAGNLDVFTRAVFTDMPAYGGGVLALAAVAFSCQLYMDFSGYCDLALGAGQVLGYDLLENFDRPFHANTFAGLWRRWHISLTDWFRRHIYFPLGGSRCAAWRTALNTMVVFLVSGLWHGAAMGYVVWGALNGAFMLIGRYTAPLRGKLAARNPLYRLTPLKNLIQRCFVFLLFVFCCVFFATCYYGGDTADALYLLGHLGAGGGPALAQLPALLGLSTLTLYILGGGILLVEVFEYFGRPHEVIRKLWLPVRWVLYYALLFAILLAADFGASGFVYGQF